MKRYITRIFSSLTFLLIPALLLAEEPDSLELSVDFNEITVTTARPRRSRLNAGNGDLISAAELKRAACCNLGESFTTNPSVDVSYSDAATGARQIRLLGLAGNYVQMLTENIPSMRGAAGVYGLGYIPGPWMQSISVSKGTASVKHGTESVAGQINVELLKPQGEQEVLANGYVDGMGKIEVNASGMHHFDESLSGGLLVHGETSTRGHDGDDDGFLDTPRVDQLSLMNRWAWLGRNYVAQVGVKFMLERRRSGQDEHHVATLVDHDHLYLIGINTRRWEAFAKQAYIFDHDNDGNVALILSGNKHNSWARWGGKRFVLDESNFYASLMFERKFGGMHSLSTGVSYVYDNFDQQLRQSHDPESPLEALPEQESVTGLYAQYSLDYDKQLLLMAGARVDYSNRSRWMFTPRVHARWNPSSLVSLHATAGRSYRATHVLAEYSYLLASSRMLIFPEGHNREEAWNTGVGTDWTFDLFSKTVNLNLEYFYTTFTNQLAVDFDTSADAVIFKNIRDRSYSHTFQAEATIQLLHDLQITAAYRLTDVRADLGKGYRFKPLTPRNKGLITAGYSPMMGLWQFDLTLALTGGGRMPDPDPEHPLWETRYKGFAQLNAQITRNFRHWAVYIGGENLTGSRQRNAIINAANPWGPGFDATMIYGPLHGANIYVGFRYNWTRY
ncbi:MAG: TonB-dependent receptor [Muribaculaceae bacterium]|nr:TonB-dependent receptor [Muribaculaceae bacterium]